MNKHEPGNAVRMASANHRRRNKVTLLTTTRREFDKVKNLKDGQTLVVECPNDIVSSARNGQDNIHHSIRRIDLLRRSFRGGYRVVRVRYEQGNEITCVIGEMPAGVSDAASFRVKVVRTVSSADAA